MIKLRDYQIKQLNFIEERINLTNVLGIESPTGSGKTYVILEYAKKWLSKPENQLSNVILTTGFNNLVFLLEKRAKEIGLKTKVLIGTKACNCPEIMIKNGLKPKVFTKNSNFKCGDTHKKLDITTNVWKNKSCPYTKDLYYNHFQEITSSVGQIVIMNHSSFLVHQNSLLNTSLVIVDEAHTFGVFYESFIKLELDKEDLNEIHSTINSLKPPMNKIVEMNIKRGVLPQVQINKLCESIKDVNLQSKTKEFFETKPAINNYIEATQDSFTIDRFYRNFEFKMNTKFLLFSATLDKYTRMMFGCKDIYYYRELKTFCDYYKSEFIAIPSKEFLESFSKFIDYVDSKNLTSGLCLSTTLYDVNQALTFDGRNGFKIFKNIEDFLNYKDKKILVGSRALFQGIDIQGLEFVCLNKIPFPNWNEKAKKMQDYITNNGKNNINFWTDFSVPKTENDIVQSTGRLWRSPDSFGVISIFDERVTKHKYIIRHVMHNYRYGIKMKIMQEDGLIENFDVKKMEEKDIRKQ